MTTVGWILVGVASVAVLVALDRLLLWAESRGWVYWRRHKPSSSSMGNAMASLQAFLEPTKEYVVEERSRQDAAIDLAADDDPLDDEDPPDDDTGRRSPPDR